VAPGQLLKKTAPPPPATKTHGSGSGSGSAIALAGLNNYSKQSFVI